jgi:predicted RNA-binding protein Jag
LLFEVLMEFRKDYIVRQRIHFGNLYKIVEETNKIQEECEDVLVQIRSSTGFSIGNSILNLLVSMMDVKIGSEINVEIDVPNYVGVTSETLESYADRIGEILTQEVREVY